MSEHFDILYVEDEAFMHEMVKTFLSEKGYTIKSATSAEEALELYKENNFDILLTDLKLPKMNGVELIKACKNLQPNQKTILITAYADPEWGNWLRAEYRQKHCGKTWWRNFCRKRSRGGCFFNNFIRFGGCICLFQKGNMMNF